MNGAQIIAIGASAGGVEALLRILPALPSGFPIPVIIVVHLPSHASSVLAEVLQAKCAIKVREAEDKEPLVPSTAYVAPPDYHLLVEPEHTLSLSVDEPVLYSRPSIDVLFESVAEVYGSQGLGVVLSGASADGSVGLRRIVESGGRAIVQRPSTASSSLMPESALAACPEAEALDLDQIAARLLSLVVAEVR